MQGYALAVGRRVDGVSGRSAWRLRKCRNACTRLLSRPLTSLLMPAPATTARSVKSDNGPAPGLAVSDYCDFGFSGQQPRSAKAIDSPN